MLFLGQGFCILGGSVHGLKSGLLWCAAVPGRIQCGWCTWTGLTCGFVHATLGAGAADVFGWVTLGDDVGLGVTVGTLGDGAGIGVFVSLTAFWKMDARSDSACDVAVVRTAKGEAGDGFLSAAVRAYAARSAVSAEERVGIGKLCGEKVTVSVTLSP